jgi:SEL1 protein
MSSVDPLETFPPVEGSSTGGKVGGASIGPPSSASSFALHYSERTKTLHKGPAASEVKEAHKLLSAAAAKGHLQAKHRLAMMHSEGVTIQTNTIRQVVIKPSCEQAASHYQWIAEHANLQLSKRLRKAYKAYIDGNVEMALRNYLAAAETGSSVGQVNAAFLLERGHCLGLSSTDCAKASVRLWKAAAARGIIEASLRVGDFYYYGRLRGKPVYIGPFAWVQYLLFPEDHLPDILARWSTIAIRKIHKQFPWLGLLKDNDDDVSTASEEFEAAADAERIQREKELLKADVATAAQYYMDAAEKYYSPRAHFNLGFMFEWGIGLKQDFPLAKRHYDLAATNNRKEAELAAQIALWAMSVHQYFIKLRLAWDQRNRKTQVVNDTVQPTSKATDSPNPKVSQAMPGSVNRLMNKTAQDIILSHIFNWSSLAILILLYILVLLQRVRYARQRR